MSAVFSEVERNLVELKEIELEPIDLTLESATLHRHQVAQCHVRSEAALNHGSQALLAKQYVDALRSGQLLLGSSRSMDALAQCFTIRYSSPGFLLHIAWGQWISVGSGHDGIILIWDFNM